MNRLILIVLVMIIFAPLVHAYDYNNRRHLQARDWKEQSEKEPKQKQIQSIKEKNKITKLKTEQRRSNQEQLRLNRKMGRGNFPGNRRGDWESFSSSKSSVRNPMY